VEDETLLSNSVLNEHLDEDTPGVDLEEVTGDDRLVEPFDPTLIRVETRPLTIDILLSRLQEGEINLAPDFQRKAGIWSNDAQSRLIESLLIRIPLPAFYFDATDDDHWVVVDGLQRLTSLRRFALDKEFRLSGLEFLTQLNGKSYEELPRNFQRRIRETQLTGFMITRGTPDEVKFTIFRRINTGGKPLSPQEIRHALNQGPITRLLAELAQSPEFQRAIDYGVSDDRMDDRELVLRFLAFKLISYTEYVRQDFDGFLHNSMRQMNSLSTDHLNELAHEFKKTMRRAHEIFERDAFRKRYAENARRKPINKPLFETWSVNLSSLNDSQFQRLQERRLLIRSQFLNLMNHDRDFDNAISQGTGDVSKVQIRFSRIQHLIEGILQ
jgi:hypothetical protein